MNYIRKLLSFFTKPSYPVAFNANELTEKESTFCIEAGLPLEDGLFLKQLTKHPLEQLAPFNAGSIPQLANRCVCSFTSEENARSLVETYRAVLCNKNQLLIITDVSYKGMGISLINNTTDPYLVMEYMGTNGLNYDIETTDVITKCKKWNSEFGVEVFAAGLDFCELKMVNKNVDFKALAAEIYEFCPDTVDQGLETVDAFEKYLKESGIIYLWWD